MIPANTIHPHMNAREQWPSLPAGQFFRFFDHMPWLDTNNWDHTDDSGTGTNALVTGYLGVGGWVDIKTAASDNDYHTMMTKNALFTFQKNSPFSFSTRVKASEATADTDDTGLIVGTIGTLTTGGLTSGTVPLASNTGAFWYKTEDTSIWRFGVQNAGAITATSAPATITPAFALGTVYTLGFDFDPNDNVTGKITPWILNEGTLAAPTAIRIVYPAIDFVMPVYTSAVLQYAVTGVVAGTGGHAQTLSVDYVEAVQVLTNGLHVFGVA